MVGHVRASGKITATFVLGFVPGACAFGVSAPGCAGGRSADPASAPAPTAAPASAFSAPGSAPSAEPAGEDLVALSLIADRAAVVPGQPVTLAARFDIDPEWHIYWENPGESGLATEVTFEAPAGFEVGAVRYPGPVAFSSPGPVVSYGYAGRVLLSAPVEVPSAAQGSATFAADAFWLACRETCVRGQGKATLTLPVLAPGREPPPADADRAALNEHTARLPRPWPAGAGARHAWEKGPAGPLLVLRLPARLASGANLVFFPSSDDQLAVTGQEQVIDGTDVVLRVSYRAEPVPARARGLLDAGDVFYQLDVSGPAAGN
jgi:DsbC/DsbD-like thiol-disulfide interchange protein